MSGDRPNTRLSLLALCRGDNAQRQRGMLGSVASALAEVSAAELWIACSAVGEPVAALTRQLWQTGVASGLACSTRLLHPAAQIAQLLAAIDSQYTAVIDEDSCLEPPCLTALLSALEAEASIPAAGELCAVERSESYCKLLQEQPWFSGWDCVPDDQRTIARVLVPGFYIVRTELLRRFRAPDAAIDHLQLAMLLSDMLHCLGEAPRQLPASVLCCVRISQGLARQPWPANGQSPRCPVNAGSPPTSSLPGQTISESQLRSMLEAARDALKARSIAEAEQLARKALSFDPNNPTALHILGMAHHRTGRHEQALGLVQRSIAMGGDLPEYHNNLGNVLVSLGRQPEAIAEFRRAIEQRPVYPQALNNLGRCLLDWGDPRQAERYLAQAAELRPGMVEAWNHRAAALWELGRCEEAMECRRRILASNPNNPLAHTQLALSLVELRRLEESEAEFAAAVGLSPQDPSVHMDRAMSWLLRGDFARGWPEYEWRLKQPDAKPAAPGNVPRWQGEDLAARTLLIRCEQGLGATIQFIRYALLLAQSAGNVVVECQPPLLPLLQSLPKPLKLVPVGSELPPADFWIPLLSIPAILGTTLQSIPRTVPYLTAEQARIDHWRERLQGYPGRRIGIAWQGNPQYGGDRFRSIPLIHYAALAWLPETTLISLQRGPGEDQLAKVSFPVACLGNELDADGPFLDTAAVIQGLDLVITSDTSIAHLAGALGRPVWVALNHTPDWRWMLERTDSPWYPTMRLFRQDRTGDWRGVFHRMAGALQEESGIGSTGAAPLRLPSHVGNRTPKGFDYFEQTYVLNLDADVDRMRKVSARLKRLDLPFQRFAALTPPPGLRSADPRFPAGHHACAMSHRAVLQQAWDRGYQSVLIFEDDAVLRDDAPQWMHRIVPELQALAWDIFYLGLHLEARGAKWGDHLLEVKCGFHTHAYAVARRAIPRLLASIDRVLERREGVHDGYEDASLLKVCAMPILAIQEPNHSRTCGRPINRIQQYFTLFDGEDFRGHCQELRELEAQCPP